MMRKAEMGARHLISQGMTKTASKPSGPRREAWDRLFLTAFEGTNPGDNLILDL